MAQVKLVEQPLLKALSEMRDRTGALSVDCMSAKVAHSRAVHRRVEDGQMEIADALFEQLILLHQCAFLSLVGQHNHSLGHCIIRLQVCWLDVAKHSATRKKSDLPLLQQA